MEHYERAETTDDIAGAKFAASDEDSELRKNFAPSLRTIMLRNARNVHQDVLLSPWREYQSHLKGVQRPQVKRQGKA